MLQVPIVRLDPELPLVKCDAAQLERAFLDPWIGLRHVDGPARQRTLDLSLIAFDTETRQPICELWEQDASIDYPVFSPLAGDARLVCTSQELAWATTEDDELSDTAVPTV